MASIKFLLQGKNDPANITVLLSLGRGRQFKRLTGLVVSPNQWRVDMPARDGKVLGRAGMPKQTTVDLKNLHADLNDFRGKLQRLINEANQVGTVIDAKWLERQIIAINSGVSDAAREQLPAILNRRIELAKGGVESLSISRIKGLISFRGVIDRYQEEVLGGRAPLVREVDKAFAQQFIDWLLGQGYSVGYVGKNIDNLKALCNYAESEGIETASTFKHIKPPQQKKQERQREKPILYLTEEEQDRIKQLSLTREALVNARKWLLFGCVVGQRGGDLLSVTENDIYEEDGVKFLELTQRKTDKTVVVPLLPQAEEVLQQGMPYGISIQKFNGYVKELCQLAGIDQPTPGAKRGEFETTGKDGKKVVQPSVKGIYPKYELMGSHVCRRSFASNFYNKIPTSILIGITGHSTEGMFLNYIGKKPKDKAHEMLRYFNRLKTEATNEPVMRVHRNSSND